MPRVRTQELRFLNEPPSEERRRSIELPPDPAFSLAQATALSPDGRCLGALQVARVQCAAAVLVDGCGLVARQRRQRLIV